MKIYEYILFCTGILILAISVFLRHVANCETALMDFIGGIGCGIVIGGIGGIIKSVIDKRRKLKEKN